MLSSAVSRGSHVPSPDGSGVHASGPCRAFSSRVRPSRRRRHSCRVPDHPSTSSRGQRDRWNVSESGCDSQDCVSGIEFAMSTNVRVSGSWDGSWDGWDGSWDESECGSVWDCDCWYGDGTLSGACVRDDYRRSPIDSVNALFVSRIRSPFRIRSPIGGANALFVSRSRSLFRGSGDDHYALFVSRSPSPFRGSSDDHHALFVSRTRSPFGESSDDHLRSPIDGVNAFFVSRSRSPFQRSIALFVSRSRSPFRAFSRRSLRRWYSGVVFSAFSRRSQSLRQIGQRSDERDGRVIRLSNDGRETYSCARESESRRVSR